MTSTGINGHRGSTNGHRPPITTREEAMGVALVLVKERGLGVRGIAEELTARGWPIGKTQAAELVKEARAAEPFLDLLDREEARKDQADRLHSYYRILLEDMRSGQLRGFEFVERMQWIENRWAKLAGLDAPKQLQVAVEDKREVTPDFAMLDALREAIREARAGGRADEAAMLEGQLTEREYAERHAERERIDRHHERLHEERGDDDGISPPCMDYSCELFEQAREAEIARSRGVTDS
jgi:hypothetical protein